MKPYILITNDDGLQAPGIRALWESLKNDYDLVVVAPSKDQSATGLSITLRDPLRLEKHFWEEGEEIWGVTGTPVDSVKMALSVILKRKPDLILSGINKGSNAGRTLLYSGTVSAVIEGAIRDIPGIALSCHDYYNPDYDSAAAMVPELVRYALEHPLPQGSMLNVNFPEKIHGPYKGIKMGRQGRGYWKENPASRSHPIDTGNYWWLGMEQAQFEEHQESDIALLAQGYVTAVPVFISDLTHHALFNERKESFETYFVKS